MIKLLEPTGADSPVFEFSRKGGGLHHLCFRCEEMKPTIDCLTDSGARLIVPPQPGEAFNNHDIAFLWVENNLNIELIDTTVKTGLVDPSEVRSQAPSADPCFQVQT